MHNGTGSSVPAQSDDRDVVYEAVVADLTSLVARIQASLTMIELAVAQEASAALQDLPAANVVVLDDVTPRYLKAGAALKACDAGLGVALHFLREPMVSGTGLHDATGSRCVTAH
ncbi:hypothetical protein JQ628_24940 [Bradyrhizobium lablabi]|uniref:hypothetical protein n=1 Tax=Bradyrhizobium lablabi TaxID=722472 RepID=UPI001BAB3743|nr:hypothetical protein [Bradyrhizobium lablabi]MBR1124792.1 hypothetical protein [Bradyrhizobium lablabi]